MNHSNGYYSHHISCWYCKTLILNQQYWIHGCPIAKIGTYVPDCLCRTTPMHVNCFMEEHLLKKDCIPLNYWLLSKDNVQRTKCYYWNCSHDKQNKNNNEEIRLLQCPLQCGHDEYKMHLKSNEYMDLYCWVDRHLVVCPKLCEAMKRRQCHVNQIETETILDTEKEKDGTMTMMTLEQRLNDVSIHSKTKTTAMIQIQEENENEEKEYEMIYI